MLVEGANLVIVSYTGDDVVTIVGGDTLKAKAAGTAVVTLGYENNQSIKIQITVTVYGRYIENDASEIVVTKTASATYSSVTDEIGGRTGVYAFTNGASASWNDRLGVYETAHPVGGTATLPNASGNAAYQNMIDKQYNYVTIDVYFTAGSGVKMSSASTGSGGTYFKSNYYHVGSTLSSVKHDNTNIGIYYRGAQVAQADKIYAGRWYTIVVDYVNTNAPNGQWAAIDFAGCYGKVYFDTVKYYFNDSCYDDYAYAEFDGYVGYDGSEMGNLESLDANSSYVKETSGDFAGSYKYTGTKSGWTERLVPYELDCIGNEKIYDSATSASANMVAKGYKYVTFDIYMQSGTIALSAPQYTYSESGTYTFDHSYNYIGAKTSSTNPYISIYQNGSKVDALPTGGWYTVVIEYSTLLDGYTRDASDTEALAADIRLSNTTTNTVAYFKDVRYYFAKPSYVA